MGKINSIFKNLFTYLSSGILCLVLIFLFKSAGLAIGDPYIVYGFVRYADSSVVVGATVTVTVGSLLSQDDVTDSGGRYSLVFMGWNDGDAITVDAVLGTFIGTSSDTITLPEGGKWINVTVNEIDTTAPSAITDLSAVNIRRTLLDLTWTAPGDDGNTGTAAQYDIRYSSIAAITDSNWNSAVQVTGEPAPSVATTTETMSITNLTPGTTYYFAMKTADEVPNWAGLSNVATALTQTIITSSPDAKNGVVYPNPYIKGKSSREAITFHNLPKKAVIRIYTLKGDLVKKIEHDEDIEGSGKEWDVNNVKSGIYLYTIISSQGIKKGKLSILK